MSSSVVSNYIVIECLIWDVIQSSSTGKLVVNVLTNIADDVSCHSYHELIHGYQAGVNGVLLSVVNLLLHPE